MSEDDELKEIMADFANGFPKITHHPNGSVTIQSNWGVITMGPVAFDNYQKKMQELAKSYNKNV